MAKRYRSEMLAAVHETAEGLHTAGLLPATTMRQFDAECLTPVRALTAKQIKKLREREGASQAVFARHLNLSTGLISKCERGEKRPMGASLKLLALVEKNGLSAVA